MSQEKSRKRDRLRAICCFERPKSPGGRTPDLHSTSVLPGAVAPKETTQLFTSPIEPSVETETGSTILDTTLNSSPTHQPNRQADTAASHNVISSENTEKLQINQDVKHNEFIKSVFHGGQTFNYGAYVSPARRDDVSMGRVG